MRYEPQTLGKMSWCCEARSHVLQIALLTGVHVHLEVQTQSLMTKNSIEKHLWHTLVRGMILLANSNVKNLFMAG